MLYGNHTCLFRQGKSSTGNKNKAAKTNTHAVFELVLERLQVCDHAHAHAHAHAHSHAHAHAHAHTRTHTHIHKHATAYHFMRHTACGFWGVLLAIQMRGPQPQH